MSRLSISKPGAPARDQLGGEDVLVGRLVGVALEVDARRADQLGDHDALGAVDDEGALGRHQGEVTHEDGLALDLAGLVVGELGGDVERGGEGEVLLLALLDGVLRVVEDGVLERERHRLGEVLDRRDLLEDLLQARLLGDVLSGFAATGHGVGPVVVADQPVEAVGLEGEELGNLERFGDLCKRDAAVDFSGAARGQELSFDGLRGEMSTLHHHIGHRAGRRASERGRTHSVAQARAHNNPGVE
jgi:hypothetical protein